MISECGHGEKIHVLLPPGSETEWRRFAELVNGSAVWRIDFWDKEWGDDHAISRWRRGKWKGQLRP